MGWQDLLGTPEGEELTLPWVGGRQVYDGKGRCWNIQGRTPREFGWYIFKCSAGRKAKLWHEIVEHLDGREEHLPVAPIEVFGAEFIGQLPEVRGYLAGDRLIPDGARVDPDPTKLIDQTETVFFIPAGLERFTRATVIRWPNLGLLFANEGFPEGPEPDVIAAYQDRKDTVGDIPEVTPALDLAFRWVSYQRAAAEARAAELERLRAEEEAKLAEEERVRRLQKRVGTAEGRRALALEDFNAAAKAALAVGGAELLDVRDGRAAGEKVVQYRIHNRRLECVCDARTLRIVSAGVCLDDHRGTKGDTWFTLESLPTVITEAIQLGRLVVYRHVRGDRDYYDDRGGW
jgi:hypothetical protein